jgi:hypothetical protein
MRPLYSQLKLCLVILLLALHTAARAGDDVDLPASFATKNDAVRQGCEFHRLKSTKTSNCVLRKFIGHDLVLTVYDPSPDGQWQQAERLSVTSWYNKAKVSYLDILGTGVDFIRVDFEGNTGSGTFQQILTLIGWRDGQFRPALMETTNYFEYEKGFKKELRMRYKSRKQGTEDVSLELVYDFSRQAPSGAIKKTWTESLKWHKNSFSFYDEKEQGAKPGDDETVIKGNLSAARRNLLRLMPETKNVSIDVDFLNQVGLMQILDDV